MILLTSYYLISLYQQSSYKLTKYKKIIKKYYGLNINSILRFLILLISCTMYLYDTYILGFIILFLTFGLFIFRKKQVLKLRLTRRIIRFLLVYIVLILTSIYINYKLIALILFLLPIIIMLVDICLKPIELIIYNYYFLKTKKKIKNLNNINIGITGSFGKTSVKNYLYEILINKYNVLKTPASYNTPMGISKVVLNDLNQFIEIFISELGATKVNDINTLVKLIPIDVGVITEIGYQHLESFKNIDNIIKTKLEILNSKKIKTLFINNDNKYLKEYHYPNFIKVIRVGTNEDSDYLIHSIKIEFNYLEFYIKHQNNDYFFKTKLLGTHNIMNLALSIGLAFEFKLEYLDIYHSVYNIKPTVNRLELKTYQDIQIIDDSFNSNPIGFNNALDVLLLSKYKKILITPGIVEIDPKYMYILDEIIKKIITNDISIYLINNQAIKYLLVKFKEFNYKSYIIFESFKEAYNYSIKESNSKKTILIENDLTDYYLGG